MSRGSAGATNSKLIRVTRARKIVRISGQANKANNRQPEVAKAIRLGKANPKTTRRRSKNRRIEETQDRKVSVANSNPNGSKPSIWSDEETTTKLPERLNVRSGTFLKFRLWIRWTAAALDFGVSRGILSK